jgi:NAD(P)H-flavin reductase
VAVIECVELATPGWNGRTGVVVDFLDEALAASGARRAALCGPPIMLHRAAEALCRRGLAPHDVHIALERYMKCGVGRCGHCYVDGCYVCTDGPVFSYAELLRLPDAFRTEALTAGARSC